MTTPPTPAPEPTPDPAPSLFTTPEQETAFKAAVKSAVAELADERTPAPDKTTKPVGIFDALFRS